MMALVPDTSISGIRVARELDRLIVAYGKPKTIVSDNGIELTSGEGLHACQGHLRRGGETLAKGAHPIVPGDENS